MSIFSTESTFSFRKLWSLVGLTLFAFAFIGNQVKTAFDEAPGQYILLIGSIVAFYFGKELIGKLKG